MSQTRPASKWKLLLPLVVWLALVAAITLFRFHRKHYSGTRIIPEVTIEGATTYQYRIFLDGRPFDVKRVPPFGLHHARVEASDCDPIERRVWIWYGENRLRSCQLARTKRAFSFSFSPTPRRMLLTGPYQTTVLDAPGNTNVSLALGDYDAVLDYGLFTNRQRFTVKATGKNSLSIQIATTYLNLTSEQDRVRYALSWYGGLLQLEGDVPASVGPLPVGRYNLARSRGTYRIEESLELQNQRTNTIALKFPYGAVRIDSKPQGASILKKEGAEVGHTPDVLSELPPGKHDFVVHRPGYERVSFSVEVREGETNSVFITHASEKFASAMRIAREGLERDPPDLDGAARAVHVALAEDPSSEAAKELKSRVELTGWTRRSEALANRNEYAGALEALDAAIALSPTNALLATRKAELIQLRAQQAEAMKTASFSTSLRDAGAALGNADLVAAKAAIDKALALKPEDPQAQDLAASISRALQKHEAEVVEQKKLGDLARKREYLNGVFSNAVSSVKDVRSFVAYGGKFPVSLPQFVEGAGRAFKADEVKWKVTESKRPRDDTWVVWAEYENLLVGQRKVALAAVEVAPGEVHFIFEIWAYFRDGSRGLALMPVTPDYFHVDRPDDSKQYCKAISASLLSALRKEIHP